jgi:hypothetical protein
MQVDISNSRYDVHQKFIVFSQEDNDELSVPWGEQWPKVFERLAAEVKRLTDAGLGVLDVDICKTNPDYGVYYTAIITYWDKY